MSFESLAQQNVRRRFTFLEIDLPFCGNIYGVNDGVTSFCAAALGAGQIKCFNTRNITNDCQDPANFNPGTKTYRFIEPQAEIPADLDGFPCLESWSTSPTEIDPDGGFGIRSAFNAVLSDFNFHDRGLDKYVAERAYNPMERGTFWGKFKARNPYYWGHPARIVTGYLDEDGNYDPANFQTRHYIVTKISGPDRSGAVSIEGRDPIKRADDDRAKFPAPSTGKTDADIDDATTSVTLTPAGIGDIEYPAAGKARMGKEIVTFTRVGDVCTIVRGDNGTVESHNAGTTFQVVGVIDSETAADIVYTLLTTRAGIDGAYLNKAGWDTEADTWFPFVYSAEIAEPTGVNKLVTELAKQAGFCIWWDDRTQLAEMQAIRSTPPDAPILTDEEHIVADSFQQEDRDDKRVSQAWVFHGLIDPAEKVDEPSNYESIQVSAIANLYESEKVDIIYSRWILRTSIDAARSVGARRVNRFQHAPRLFTFQLDAKDYATWTGVMRRLNHRNLQDASGATDLVPVQVLSVKDNGSNVYAYKAIEYRVPPLDDGIKTLTIDFETSDYIVRDAYEAQYGAITSAVEVRVIIEGTGQVTGITGGGMPEGSVIRLDVLDGGGLEGHPGDGGDGGDVSGGWDGSQWFVDRFTNMNGRAGASGGDAITMTEDWVIRRFGSAIITAGSGGGGGGGAHGDGIRAEFHSGGGGGGARTLSSSMGGAGGDVTVTGEAPGNEQVGDAGGDGDPTGAGSGGDGHLAGSGGDGGGYAQPGADGADGYLRPAKFQPAQTIPGGKGGAPGLLARTNGYTLTFAEGNDPAFVFGEID